MKEGEGERAGRVEVSRVGRCGIAVLVGGARPRRGVAARANLVVELAGGRRAAGRSGRERGKELDGNRVFFAAMPGGAGGFVYGAEDMV